jgi:hypothetical protein
VAGARGRGGGGLPEAPGPGDIARLSLTRDVFREALRLYPPVPMMVREAARTGDVPQPDGAAGAQVVISPWHLHRHTRLWENPDGFDPGRWGTENGKACQRRPIIPFSAGRAGLSRGGVRDDGGPLLLALLLRRFRFETVAGAEPVPVAFLTVRARDGIRLRVSGGEEAEISRFPYGKLQFSRSEKLQFFCRRNACALGRRIFTGSALQNMTIWPAFSTARKPRPVHFLDERLAPM